MEEQDKDMDRMRQEINNLREQVSKILELLSMGRGKVVVDTTQSSNSVQDTDDPIYPSGFTPCHMNVPHPQTTQHYVATNPHFLVPFFVPDIEQLEVQAKIQDMGQNENTPAKQKLDVLEERLRAIEGNNVYGNIDATQLCLVPSLIIPTKFKVPEFDKYDGSSCRRSHLVIIECGIKHGRLTEATTEYGGIKKGTISENKEGELAPIQMVPIQPPYPKWYDSNARCDYHAEAMGHSTKNCLALKRNVQSLINVGGLSFKKFGEKLNVNENPLPNYENSKVNVVDGLVEK
ncbi:Gag-pro-like protein [Cucumis melo var. makuwa]|uniref:Gag-pro-like protein n=1 Tax=Cucumis melo var. makuwa TaxID=1194695 RepID=A0A5A7VEB9_CUCMM|nr:Gag-pro-like protein [Cucumis melo var. makuwa]